MPTRTRGTRLLATAAVGLTAALLLAAPGLAFAPTAFIQISWSSGNGFTVVSTPAIMPACHYDALGAHGMNVACDIIPGQKCLSTLVLDNADVGGQTGTAWCLGNYGGAPGEATCTETTGVCTNSGTGLPLSVDATLFACTAADPPAGTTSYNVACFGN